MSSTRKNLSSFDRSGMPDASSMRIGIVVSQWNHDITSKLFEGAEKTLSDFGCRAENIMIRNVPGSYELIAGAMFLAEYEDVDAVICLGCVIQGETRHFEFICQSVAQGLMDLTIKYGRPFIFGVLTTDNHSQAVDRAGGKHGNKGVEAAVTAIKMVSLHNEFE